MSIDQMDVVDGLFIRKNEKVLYMMISDHIDGSNPEYHKVHLDMLQDKIDAYLDYIEEEQYLTQFPGLKPAGFAIEVNFRHPIVQACIEFLKSKGERVSKGRKAQGINEKIFFIVYPPEVDKATGKGGYIINYEPEDADLLDWENLNVLEG